MRRMSQCFEQQQANAYHNGEIGDVENAGTQHRPDAEIEEIGHGALLPDPVNEIAQPAGHDQRARDDARQRQIGRGEQVEDDARQQHGDENAKDQRARLRRQIGAQAQKCAGVLGIFQAQRVPQQRDGRAESQTLAGDGFGRLIQPQTQPGDKAQQRDAAPSRHGRHPSSRPSARARAAASVRLRTCSLSKMALTWVLTVLSETTSVAAISGLLRPPAR